MTTNKETIDLAYQMIGALPDGYNDALGAVFAATSAAGILLQIALNTGAIGPGNGQKTLDMCTAIIEELAILPCPDLQAPGRAA